MSAPKKTIPPGKGDQPKKQIPPGKGGGAPKKGIPPWGPKKNPLPLGVLAVAVAAGTAGRPGN